MQVTSDATIPKPVSRLPSSLAVIEYTGMWNRHSYGLILTAAGGIRGRHRAKFGLVVAVSRRPYKLSALALEYASVLQLCVSLFLSSHCTLFVLTAYAHCSLGPALMGTIINVFLFGVMGTQCFIYYSRYPKCAMICYLSSSLYSLSVSDKLWLKLLVRSLVHDASR